MRRNATLITALIVTLLSAPLAAEVGVLVLNDRLDANGIPLGTPYLQSITDLPDPISTWHRHSPVSDTRLRVLNAGGAANGDGEPAVLYHSGLERTLVFWSQNRAEGGYKIVFAEYKDGVWTNPRQTNAFPGQQYDPQVVAGPDGTVYVAYWQINGVEHSVWWQTISATDGTWSAPVMVSTPGIASCRPSVTVHAGVPRVVFEAHPNGADTFPKEIVVADFENDAFATQVIASSSHDGPLWPKIHSNGATLWVDWVDFATTPFDGDMAWLKKTNTSWSTIDYEPFDSEADLEFNVRQVIAFEAAETSGGTGGGHTQIPPMQPLP